MKSQIFKTAWQFFKQTGLVFSECLKKAWHAFGRLYNVPEIKGVKQGNENLFTYFDTVADAWRSFYKFNLVA